jgi:hypothetical protein
MQGQALGQLRRPASFFVRYGTGIAGWRAGCGIAFYENNDIYDLRRWPAVAGKDRAGGSISGEDRSSAPGCVAVRKSVFIDYK